MIVGDFGAALRHLQAFCTVNGFMEVASDLRQPAARQSVPSSRPRKGGRPRERDARPHAARTAGPDRASASHFPLGAAVLARIRRVAEEMRTRRGPAPASGLHHACARGPTRSRLVPSARIARSFTYDHPRRAPNARIPCITRQTGRPPGCLPWQSCARRRSHPGPGERPIGGIGARLAGMTGQGRLDRLLASSPGSPICPAPPQPQWTLDPPPRPRP